MFIEHVFFYVPHDIMLYFFSSFYFCQRRRMEIFISIGIILIFHFNWYHSHISFQLVSFIYIFHLISFMYFFSFGIFTIFQLVSIHSIFLSHFFSSLFNFVKGGEKCRILNDILYPHLSIY